MNKHLSLADDPAALYELSNDELAEVIAELLDEAEAEPVSDEQIVEITDAEPADDLEDEVTGRWFRDGERLSAPADLESVRTTRLLKEFADLG